MAATTTEVIGTIGAIQTLIENFPMSIFELFGNKVYTSVIDFVMDVLKQLGVSDTILVDKLIELFFDVPNASEVYGNIKNYQYKQIKKPTDEQKAQAIEVPEVPTENIDSLSPNYIVVRPESDFEFLTIDNGTYYVKKAPVPDEPQSEFIIGLENAVKSIISTILTSLLSCSVNPEIPSQYMDYNPRGDGYISFTIPKNLIDMFNLLDIYPLSDIGSNFYSGVDDETLNVNTLYKVNDLNAFLWYVINRGTSINQTETNKMMWDSRVVDEREGAEEDLRSTPEKWNEWLNSKTDETGLFTISDASRYQNAYTSDDGKGNDTVDLPLHPILQLKPTDVYGYNNGIEVTFPQQTWYRNALFNKTIYRFNIDYLNNIQLFNPRLILSEMVDSLLNGSLLFDLNIQYSIQTKIFEAKLNQIIQKALEVEDLSVEDCFFSFSNDDFNDALKAMELQRYGAKELNSETSPAIKIDKEIGIDAMNEINSMATMNEKISSISRTVYDISAIPTQDSAIEISDKLSVGYNEKWLNDVVMALVMPLAKAMFTPKVMLLFVINFEIMGLINVNNIKSIDDVMELFIKKLLSIIISIVRYVKDKIVEFLYKLFLKYIKPLLIEWGALILAEKLAAWIELLEEAISCIPLFKPTKALTEIDDVNYADITQTQDIPESEKSC